MLALVLWVTTKLTGFDKSTRTPLHDVQVTAGMFELGCIFHSFIIGLAVGINTEDVSAVSIFKWRIVVRFT